MNQPYPTIAVTQGDPAGIGPDIIAAAAMHSFDAKVIVIGDPDVIANRAKQIDLPLTLRRVNQPADVQNHTPGELYVLPINCKHPVEPGILNAQNSTQVIECIDAATDGCNGKHYDAMVTAPVHKAVINDGGIKFSGHTEWVAARCGDVHPVMMLANSNLRVCLATIHLPLRKVAEAINAEELERVIRIMSTDISKLYGIASPRIGICGLNPHAGEGGYLGTEEIDIIEPVIKKLTADGLQLIGPLPADTAFTQEQLKSLDAVLAMYHDQGLPVIKHQGFGEVVNVTLGLPIIRTSVDHGTALPLAGTGEACAASLISAINLAILFANNKSSNT